MKATTMTVKVMAHFRAEEIGGGSSAEDVPPVAAGTPAVAPGACRPSVVTWDGGLTGQPAACRYCCSLPSRHSAGSRVVEQDVDGPPGVICASFAQPGESTGYFTSGRPATLRIFAI